MKKIIGIAAIAAMVATSAFAEITFGAWGRSGLDFGNVSSGSAYDISTNDSTTIDPTDATLAATPSWAAGSRVGFSVAGKNDDGTVGFNVNVDANGGTFGVGDQAKVWGKLGFMEVQFGKIQLDDLRGSIGDWGNREEFNQKGEDAIFTRFYPKEGMTVALRPIEGLFIGAAIDTGTGTARLEDAFKAVQVGLGYTVKDTVQLKAQYIGSAVEDHYGTLEFGADLLMIKNNLIEIGAKLPMAKDNADGYFNAIVALSGSADKLTYKGHLFADFGHSSTYVYQSVADKLAGGSATMTFNEDNDPTTVGLDACAEYDVGVCSIGLTGAYVAGFNTVDLGGSDDYKIVTNTIGVELYAKKGFSNGYLFGGVADKMVFTSESASDSGTSFINTFNIPVGAEYWF